MERLFLRLVLLTPWVFLIWLIAQGMAGAISGLLVFVLLFILIPGAIVLNLVTVVLFKSRGTIKVMREVQKTGKAPQKTALKSENYAELPWWNPKRWLK